MPDDQSSHDRPDFQPNGWQQQPPSGQPQGMSQPSTPQQWQTPSADPYGQAPQAARDPYAGAPTAGQPPNQAPYASATSGGAPYGTGPGNGAPYGTAPGNGAPYAGGPATASAAPGGPSGRSKTPFIIGGAIAALVLVIALIASQLGGHDKGTASSGGTETAGGTSTSSSTESTSTAGPAKSPAEAAKAFLEAWSRGDSQGMRDTMLGDPDSPDLLTDEVLKQQLAKAPVTDIQTSDMSSDAARATWKQGGKDMTSRIETYKSYDGNYKVTWHSRTSLYALSPEKLTVKVDGVQVTKSSVQLTPGDHTVTIDDTMLAPSKPTITVKNFSDTADYSGELSYNDATQKSLRAATSKQMTACLAAKKLDNPTCGINFNSRTYDGSTLDPKTMACSITKGASSLSRLVFEPDSSDPTQAKADLDVDLSCKIRSSKGDSYRGSESYYRVTVDTGAKPMAVTFQ